MCERLSCFESLLLSVRDFHLSSAVSCSFMNIAICHNEKVFCESSTTSKMAEHFFAPREPGAAPF